MEHLKTPLSKVASVLRVRSEGLGLRATARVFGIHKNTVADWEERFAAQKGPLMLYAVCHEFISLTFEGDELYTVIGARCDPSESEGWTAVVMERASRFITSTGSVHRIEQRCGQKDAERCTEPVEVMFRAVMSTVARYASTGSAQALSRARMSHSCPTGSGVTGTCSPPINFLTASVNR